MSGPQEFRLGGDKAKYGQSSYSRQETFALTVGLLPIRQNYCQIRVFFRAIPRVTPVQLEPSRVTSVTDNFPPVPIFCRFPKKQGGRPRNPRRMNILHATHLFGIFCRSYSG